MIVKIFGWMWIIAGALFVLKPQILRNRLQKKGLRKLKRFFMVLTIVLGSALISIGIKHEGILAKIIMVMGIIGILKAFFFVKGTLTDKIAEWWSTKPLIYFRLGGIFWITMGIMILILK